MTDWKYNNTKPHDATAAEDFHQMLSIYYNARKKGNPAVAAKMTGVGA